MLVEIKTKAEMKKTKTADPQTYRGGLTAVSIYDMVCI